MSDHPTSQPDHPAVDPHRDAPTNAFDAPTGYSGQDYKLEREETEGDKRPSGHPLVGDPDMVESPLPDVEGRNIPPENGKRGWIDPATGEVHGSGSGAGGGNPGEGFDADMPGHY